MPDRRTETASAALMTAAEYEARMRRLKADAENARKALVAARAYYEGKCADIQTLRITYREQQAAAGQGGDQ